MKFLKLIIFFWTFSGLVADLEAIKCPKGQGLIKQHNKCEVCMQGYFQPEDNFTERCKACRKCDTAKGSTVIHNCTSVTNRQCQCAKGWESLEDDSVTCRCHIGHGIQNGECVKCKDGYFSKTPNSSCEKWRECPSGVKENGTNIKNVICKDGEITTDPTPNRTPSFTIRLLSTRQRTTITTAPLVTSKDEDLTSKSLYTVKHIGLVLIIHGIIGLLILTALICKLCTCVRRKTQTRDSLCRKPVEESGDSSLTLLKQNPEEP